MKFKPGQIVVTRGVSIKMEEIDSFRLFVNNCLSRHLECDFGDIPQEDRLCNLYAVDNEERIFSAYIQAELRLKIWIISEADRTITTVLFPEEY